MDSTVIAQPSLRDLALAMGTDKEGAHSYTSAYERHLERFRDRPITMLEIGVGGYGDPNRGGASLRMWKAYFPLGHIIGIDVQDKTQFSEDRITILQGDQGDPVFLSDLAARFGPFDVVIDDGSHRCQHVITSFGALFPHVRDGGVYVIEDLQTSYWEKYGGSSTPNSPGTSMTLLQRLTDGLNYAEFDIPNYVPTYTDLWVRSITFYHNIAFIEKAPNLERSNMLPPHPRPNRRFALPPPKPPERPVEKAPLDRARKARAKPARAKTPASAVRRVARRIVPRPVRQALARPLRRAAVAIGIAERRD